jgi:RNA 2',3'-cyclic 3'-phosphodiesterase
MPRLFVAVWPPDDVLDRLAALERPEVAGLRWTTREQWHVTVRFLGQVVDVEAVVAALSGLDVETGVARLGPAVDRFGRRILHVPVAGLDAIAADVVRVSAGQGEPPDDRPFRGHITLARARERGNVDLRSYAGAPVAGAWSVTEICLVESRLSPHGARYGVVERFPLTNL